MSKSRFSHVRIAGITGVVPEHCITIDDEIQFYGGDEKLLNRNKKILGLGKRYVVDEYTTLSDLSEAAANDLFEQLGVDRSTVDALIVGSTSHDYRAPATACILQARLGLSQDCTCYDQAGLGCTAYVHALLQAHALIESGAMRRVLTIVGDLTSTHSDKRNRNVNMLFGDAVVATLIEYSEEKVQSFFVTGTDGMGWNKIIAPATGHALPVRADLVNREEVDADGNVWNLWDDILKGMAVFKFSTVAGPASIKETLSLAGKTVEDVDYFAFHQANKQIVRTVAGYVGLPKEKFSTQTFADYANCSAASVATDLLREYASKQPGLTMLVSFGVGLSWGTALLDLSQAKMGGIRPYVTPGSKKISRAEKIQKWVDYFKGGNDVEG